MVKYDYSLDVGQSIETDKKLKQKEKEQPEGCCKVSQESLEVGDEPVEKKEEPKKEPEEKKKEETVEIKPISFEKAKLISDFEGEEKEKPEVEEKPAEEKKEEAPKEEILEEQKADQEEDEPEEETKDPEEDEQDVNEFIEDSFSKETKEYESHNNNRIYDVAPKKRSWKLPIAVIILLILVGFFGYFYITEPSPTGTVTAAPEVELKEPPVIVPNITEPVIENITEPEPVVIPEEPEPKKQNISDALERLSIALKDQ